jgi:hypothetical protein
MPQGKHSRASDVGSYVVDQAGCGAAGVAILGPAVYNPEDGATILPQGKHSRASDVGSYVVDQAGCGTSGPAILGPAEFDPEDGATILPQGKHSRASDVGSYVVEQSGCGAAGPAILGPAKNTPTKGASILPKGKHSRLSDVGSYITDRAGCGPIQKWADVRPTRRFARQRKLGDSLKAVEEEEDDHDSEAVARARADTVEQVAPLAPREPCPFARPTSVTHAPLPGPPAPKPKRFTLKNFKRFFWQMQLACTPTSFLDTDINF